MIRRAVTKLALASFIFFFSISLGIEMRIL